MGDLDDGDGDGDSNVAFATKNEDRDDTGHHDDDDDDDDHDDDLFTRCSVGLPSCLTTRDSLLFAGTSQHGVDRHC